MSRLRVHAVHDRKRFQLISEVADDPAARLESLLDGDADPLHGRAGRLDDLDQPLQRSSVGKKIIDDQYMILRAEELLRHNDMIPAFMGE